MRETGIFFRRASRKAFTMIEMMAVILIVAILAGSATFYIADTMAALRLSMTGEQLLALFSSAQQTASSEGRIVELRFLKYQDERQSVQDPFYRAAIILRHYQAGEASPDPADRGTPLTAPMSLVSGDRVDASTGIVFSEDSSMSTLLGSSAVRTSSDVSGEAKVKGLGGKLETWTFPRKITSSTSILIRPDGTTNLDPSQKWFITALYERAETSSDKSAVKNFYCIQIDPSNSRIVSYRP